MDTGYLPGLCGISSEVLSNNISPEMVIPGQQLTASLNVSTAAGISAVGCSWATSCTINGAGVGSTTDYRVPLGPACSIGVFAQQWYPLPQGLAPPGATSVSITAVFTIDPAAYGQFDPNDPFPYGCYVGVGNQGDSVQAWSAYFPFNVQAQPEPVTCTI